MMSDETLARAEALARQLARDARASASAARERAAEDEREEPGGAEAERRLLDKVEEVLVDEFGLAAFGKVIVQKWLKKMAHDPRGLEHVRDWFMLLLNKRRPKKESVSRWQWGCPDIVPGLTARPFWEAERGTLAFLDELEKNVDVIAGELERMQGNPVFQPYRAPTWANPNRQAPDGVGSLGHTSGDWNVCYLFLHNVDFKDNLALFPETAALIKNIPGWYQHAFFSVLAPDTHIAKHHGPTNKKLRVHLPLIVPPGQSSGIRVGDAKRNFERGRCLVFDDSFEHEAWNSHPSCGRICLIFDIWHPDLSTQEVNLLRFLEKAKMHRAKRVCSRTDSDDGKPVAQGSTAKDSSSPQPAADENESHNQAQRQAEAAAPVLPESENFYALLERTKTMRKELGSGISPTAWRGTGDEPAPARPV